MEILRANIQMSFKFCGDELRKNNSSFIRILIITFFFHYEFDDFKSIETLQKIWYEKNFAFKTSD